VSIRVKFVTSNVPSKAEYLLTVPINLTRVVKPKISLVLKSCPDAWSNYKMNTGDKIDARELAKTNFPLLSRDWDIGYSFSFIQGFWYRIQIGRTIRSCVISVIVLRNSIDCFDIILFGAVRKRSFAILLWMKPFKLFSSVQPFDFIHAKKIYIRAAVRLHPCEKKITTV